MPLDLQAGELVLFPAPFVPTEHHRLIVTNRRVVQYAPVGAFPIAEFEVGKIEFIGRMSERPRKGLAIAIIALGLILFIVGAMKVLPVALYAGAAKDKTEEVEPEETLDGRLVEGKDNDDEFPFYDKEIEKKSVAAKAGSTLKKLKQIKPGLPPLTKDVKKGLLFWFLAFCCFVPASLLYKKEEFFIFCRCGGALHRLQVQNATQQNVVLTTLQAAQQSAPKY
jgi:hypothetical protein